MSKLCPFDPGRAYEHTSALCYPRRVGTPGERRAARYILRHFAGLGLVCRRERFIVSHFPAEVGSRLVFAGCAGLVLAGAALAPGWPLLAAGAWAVALLLVNLPWSASALPLPGGPWPPRTTSANLVATLPAPVEDAPARVLFMAHYDTKSQLLPTGIRAGLVCAIALACALLTLGGLAAAVGLLGAWASGPPWILAFVVVGMLAALVLNVTGNRSPGAVDNGSAVGTLLELARTWRPVPEAPVEVLWVASGCEEVGLDGARHFLWQHRAWWDDKPTLLINLESVGAGARVLLAGERQALKLAGAVADELGLPHARFRVLGAGMDHEPFAAAGLPAVSLLGDVVRASLLLHSPRDNLRIIDPDALDRAGRLAAQLARRWAERHQPANQDAVAVLATRLPG